jgi:hypothetical protein
MEQGVSLIQKNPLHKLTAETAIFYQDKAPCHAADSVQQQLIAIVPSFVPNASKPPNSPDLNVLDHRVWSLLEKRLNKYGLIPNFKKLRKILKKEWRAIPQETIKEAVDSWLSRVYAVEKAQGGYIV